MEQFRTRIGVCFLVPGAMFLSVAIGDETLDFNRDIRPILSDKCFFCHGPDAHERKADLRLDVSEGALSDLGGYRAIVPGRPEESELVARITDPEEPMPPVDSHKKLKPGEIALLTKWIEEGGEYSSPWAYVRPEKAPVPDVKDDRWPVNWVDHFILSRLEKEGWQPSPEAGSVTLIRRLFFDLTGLPPQPETVDAYVSGNLEYDDIVSSLLDSPQFGERMAIYWLDLVRYADTVGYHGDQDHSISPYRDYVIRAFNRNLPFDQFTREQLGGDLLENPGKWQRVASGYNRLLQTSHEGGIQQKEYNAIYAADRVRNLSAVWMAGTMGCAQCHDHKFDPYTTRDHYSMAAFFADVHDDGYNGNGLPTNRPPEMLFFDDSDEEELNRVKTEMRALLNEDWNEVEKLEAKRADLESAMKVGKGSKDKIGKEMALLDERILEAVPETKQAGWKKLSARRSEIRSRGRRTMITEAKVPRVMRVLPRGNWQDDSGDIVGPAVPEFLGRIESQEEGKVDRLDLAQWLTDPRQGVGGLTARVFANRLWYLFFGTGISRSLDDFGGQGEPPSHPELLDRLAVSFYENGWDVKELVRLLVTSRTYRQSSLAPAELRERDPHNQLFARQSRYRLPAEMIRDQALAVSGLLQKEVGGPSVKPYQPAGYYRHLNFPKRSYVMHQDSRQWRRGLYVHWQRMFLHPMLKAMDAPSREECTARRPRSNTPNAALVLLNDPTFVESSRVLAGRMIDEGGAGVEERIRFAGKLVLSRELEREEIRILEVLLDETKREYLRDPAAAGNLVEVGLASHEGKHAPVELASWTAVARALLNLNETVTRN